MLTHLLVLAALGFPSDSIVLRVLSINDFHGTLEPRTYPWSGGRPVGGLAALKATIDGLAAQCGCPTLRLDAGDEMQGSLASNLVFGRSVIEGMNALGLDAAAIGNHELDWGVDTLSARIHDAKYPWLAANVFDSATGKRPTWAKPFAIVTAGPYRVAVIGYLTPSTKTIVADQNVRGLHFRPGRPAIDDVVAEAKEAHPDFTMMVAHEGARCDSVACVGEIMALSRQFDSATFDLIVAGHTHTLINTVDRGTPIVSARSNSTNVGVADLVRSPDGSRHWRVRIETVYADRIQPDSVGAAIVAHYQPLVEQLAKRVIAELGDSLVTTRGEYPLGNIIADAQRNVAPADFGLMNNGGIRRSLLPGPITYAQLFEVQPFTNNVVRVNLTGRDLKLVLEHALGDGVPENHVSGMVVRYDPTRPKGERVLEIRKDDGTLVDPKRFYVLALSDFLAGGGGGFDMLRPLTQLRTGKTDLEALINWLVAMPQPIRAPKDHRWIAVTP